MKKYTKTALGLLLSVTIIASSTGANAFLGLWGDDEKDNLKDQRRAPILNGQSAYQNAPDPNLAYGSMPNPSNPYGSTPDYSMAAPAPQVNQGPIDMQAPQFNAQMSAPQLPPMPQMQAPGMPQIPEPPQIPPSPQWQSPQFSAQATAPQVQFTPPPQPQMAMPAMPPLTIQPPEPAPYIQPPVQTQASTYIGPDGYPKLNSIPPAPVSQVPTQPDNAKIDALKQDLRNSQNMAGIPPIAPAQPVGVPQMPNAMPDVNPVPPAPMANLTPVAPEPAPVAPIMPAPEWAAAAPQPSSVAPVFPSGPSVTVHSKRTGGGTTTNAQGIQPPSPDQVAAFTPPPPPYQGFPDPAVAAPAPMVQSAPMPPAQTAFAPPPPPVIMPEKNVDVASAPMASSFDNPIDAPYGNAGYAGVSNGSYTVGSNQASGAHHSGLLPRSRYENYRKRSQ